MRLLYKDLLPLLVTLTVLWVNWRADSFWLSGGGRSISRRVRHRDAHVDRFRSAAAVNRLGVGLLSGVSLRRCSATTVPSGVLCCVARKENVFRLAVVGDAARTLILFCYHMFDVLMYIYFIFLSIKSTRRVYTSHVVPHY